MFLVMGGVGVRIAQLYRLLPEGLWVSSLQIGTGLIGLGLVVSTGSYLVILVGVLLVMTYVLNNSDSALSDIQGEDLKYSKGWRLVSEGFIGVTAVAVCMFLQGITGIVPFF